ncbi:MAG: type II toxin-antitoxin system VapC family toxin [Gammaproteobacteria bacterium]|nr:type II toxin-antitoxin system VapC family toxin [Gammaproteobacteria bacterium]
MKHLADTNILSELARRQPDPGVQAWADSLPALFLSAVAVDEIVFGLAKKPNLRVQHWFEGFLAEFCEVLPVDEAIARHAGELRGQFAGRGIARTQADMLIAATALVHHLILVTRNVDDFEDCGVQVLNPFER